MKKHDHGLTDILVFAIRFALVGAICFIPSALAQVSTPITSTEVSEVQCIGYDNTALDHYRRATEFNRAGQNEEAAREYLSVIQCDRDYAMAYRGLARAYEQQGRTDEAIALFEQMLKSDRQNALAHYAIGWLYRSGEDDWENVEAEWRAALEIDPQCAIALNGMGIVYKHQSDEERALAMYRAAMATDPGLKFPRDNILGIYAGELTDEETTSLIASLEENLRFDPQQEFADEKLHVIGTLNMKLDQGDEARQSYQRLLTEYPDSLWADYAYFNIALSYMKTGQYEKAIEPFMIGISQFPDSATVGGMKQMLGLAHLYLGNDGEAYRFLAAGLDEHPDFYNPFTQIILKSLGTGAGEVYRLTDRGQIAKDRADYETALEYLEQARTIAVSHGLVYAEMGALSCLATVFEDLGHYGDAQIHYQRLLDLALEQNDELFVGLAYGGLGNEALKQGEYYSALSHYEQAIAAFEQVPETQASSSQMRSLFANAYGNIGAVHYLLNNYELALDLTRRALDAGDGGIFADRTQVIKLLANLGVVYGELGKYDLALEYFAQALELCEGEDRLGDMLVKPHYNIGELYFDMGRFEDALGEFEVVLQIATEREVPHWELLARKYIGAVHAAQGNCEFASAEFEMALDIARELNQLASEARLLDSLGECYRELGQKTTALRYYRDAASALEGYVGGLSFGETRARAFGEGRFSLYVDWMALSIEMGEEHETFEASERARARAFLDSMATGPIDFREGADFDLLERERTLRTEITALDNRLRAEISQPRDEQNAQVIEDLQAQLEERRSEYSLLLNQIQATNPEYASLAMVSTATVTETQQSLDDQTTLLEYFVASEEETVAFVLTHDSFNAITIPVGSDQLTEEITVFRDFASRDQPHPKSLVQLYEWLIAPVREYLHTPFLGIVPHGVLHYLPFAALTDGEHYLLDDFTLFSLPSASVLPFVQQHAAQTGSGLLALAQPDAEGLSHLAYAVEEAETIAELWGTRAMVGEDATETAVYDQVSDAGVVHIAAHGEFHPFSPLFSAVVLSADDQNDGRLEVHEVYGLDLTQADLVVLSGCQTDMAHLTDGDELIGLNRALLFAGTPTVVGSLWRVDDESTSFLMERFHAYLREGMGKAEALRQAQIDARDRYPHPYYWAGFVLTGNPAGSIIVPQDAVRRFPWWTYAGGVFLVVIGLVIRLLARRRK